MPSGGVITLPDNAPRRRPLYTGRSVRWTVLAAVGTVVAVFLVGWAGWLLHAATHPGKDVRVSSVFTGTVTLVGNGGSSGCIKPETGKPVCSVFHVDPSAPPLRVGQKVHAALEWANDGHSGSQNLLLVYSPTG